MSQRDRTVPRRLLTEHPAIGQPVRLNPDNRHPIAHFHPCEEGVIAQVWQFAAGVMVSVHLKGGVIIDGLLFWELTDQNGYPLHWS